MTLLNSATGRLRSLLPGQMLSRIDAVKAPRFPRRFRTRIFMYITALSLTTAIASAGIYYWRQLGFIEKDRNRRANTLLTGLATQAELGAYAGDAALCELAARRTINEEDVALVAVYDRRGHDILSFSRQPLSPPPPAVMSVLKRLLAQTEPRPEFLRHDDFDDLYAPIITYTRDPAEAVFGPGGHPQRREVVGVARIGLSLEPAREQLAEVVRWGAYLAVGLLAVGIVAAFLISRRVSRPIAALTRGADLIRAGYLDTRVQIPSQDELGQLGYSFNRMAARLTDTMNALETLNRDLEAEVARRTVAIQRAASFTGLLNAPMGQKDLAPPTATGSKDEGGSATGTLARLLHNALVALTAGTGARAAAAYLACEDALEFELELAWHVGAEASDFGPLPPHDRLARAAAWLDEHRRLILPLLLGNQPEGCIVVLCDNPPGDEMIQFASHAASQLVIAVSNQRTYAALTHLARELKERNAALGKQRDQLQEMNRLKSEFLANTSHELRTPLNAIIGYAELLAEGLYGDVNDDQKEPLAGIDESGRNLLSLINQILDLAKVEAGKMTVHLEEIDLDELVRSVVSEAGPLAKDRPYHIQLDTPGKLLLHSDGAKVKQIVTNLVSNAIKFTAEGQVEVSVRPEAAGGCIIAVRDTGIGIRTEDQRIIFEEFRQVDGSSTRAYGGTGLGLAIARRLSELLGGEITVESKLDEGSTFTLRLPREPPSGVVMLPRRAVVPPPLPREAREGRPA